MARLTRLLSTLAALTAILIFRATRAAKTPPPQEQHQTTSPEPVPKWVREWKREFPGAQLGAWPD